MRSPLRRALSAARHPVRSVRRIIAGPPPAKPSSQKTKAPQSTAPKTSVSKPAASAPKRGTFAASKLSAWIASDFAAAPESLGIDSAVPIPRTSLRAGRYRLVDFVAHEAYLPPDENVAFATALNDKYVMGLEALVYSLRQVYPGFASDIHVFHDDSLSDFNLDRLASVYAGFVFHPSDTAKYSVVQLGDSSNHARVGLLGYLSLEAIALEDYDRVIVIDSDILVLGDISPLWSGDERPKAVPDAGALPFSLISETTGNPVINSGVISLPRSLRGPEAFADALATLATVSENQDSTIRRFADQKFWNIWLADKNLELLPTNFNANHRGIENYFPDSLAAVSALHITGVKPWVEYLPTEEKTTEEIAAHATAAKEHPVTFALWRRSFGQGARRARLDAFRASELESLAALEGSAAGRPAVMIGNGPSIAKTDLSVFDGFEKFAFNWFVNHPGFDEVKPDHLVLASAKFFGGWHASRPSWPAGYLEALLAREHKPRLWVSFYFKHLIDSTPELSGYDVSYFLFEKPFKPMLQKTGRVKLDVTAPLADSLTGVLSAGVPLALHFGATAVALVGCDSNYANETGSYFYDSSKHTSPTNTTANLVSTWGSAASVGQYCYGEFTTALEARGIRFVDSTIDGALRTVPKLPLADARSLLAPATS